MDFFSCTKVQHDFKFEARLSMADALCFEWKPLGSGGHSISPDKRKVKKTATQGWNLTMRSSTTFKSTEVPIGKVRLRVDHINSDKSGYVMGLFQASSTESSLNSLKEKGICVSGKGSNQHQNTVHSVSNWDMEVNSIIMISWD